MRRFIPGLGVDQRVAWIECGTSTSCVPNQTGAATYLYFVDRLGNVAAVVDGATGSMQRYFYTPFGIETRGDATGNPFRYTGRRFDPETGLYYYRARYYDADLGRFLQVDPIGYADQWNLYAYVGNNPLNATDPTGMQSRAAIRASRMAGGPGAPQEVPAEVVDDFERAASYAGCALGGDCTRLWSDGLRTSKAIILSGISHQNDSQDGNGDW